MSNQWHLREDDFFHGLEPEREAFLAAAVCRTLKKGDFVFYEGDFGDSCFYLAAGAVKIFKSGLLGKEPIFFLRKPGEVFGLAEVIDAKERKANAQAIGPCEVYELSREELERIMARHYFLARRVIETLGRRLRYLGEQVESLMVCDVSTRLLKLLVHLACDRSEKGYCLDGSITVPVALTQEQIAAMTGSCQQTVSETLKRLQEEGLTRVTRKDFTILDPAEVLRRIEM